MNTVIVSSHIFDIDRVVRGFAYTAICCGETYMNCKRATLHRTLSETGQMLPQIAVKLVQAIN